MSLQPGINPLEAASMYGITGPMPGVITGNRRMPTDEDTGHRSFPNMGGFDPSDLMRKPEMRQKETRNQANMVSAPYREANMMAAEKTNPMNAASQDPGKEFLQDYLRPKDQGPLRSFESPMIPFLIPKR